MLVSGLLNVLNHTLMLVQTIYKALVQSYFDYYSTLCGNCGKSLQDKLQKLQSRAVRLITGETLYDIRSTDILNSLSWETLDNRRKKIQGSIYV